MQKTLAKIFGWAFFGLQLASSIFAAGSPHGAAGILQAIGAGAAAVGVHLASNSGPTS